MLTTFRIRRSTIKIYRSCNSSGTYQGDCILVTEGYLFATELMAVLTLL